MAKRFFSILVLVGVYIIPPLLVADQYKIITHTTQTMKDAEIAKEKVLQRLQQNPGFQKLQDKCTFHVNCRPSGNYCIVTIEPIGSRNILDKLYTIVKKIYSDAFINKYDTPKTVAADDNKLQNESSVAETLDKTLIAEVIEKTQPDIAENSDKPLLETTASTINIDDNLSELPQIIKLIQEETETEIFSYQQYLFVFIVSSTLFFLLILWLRKEKNSTMHTNIDNNLLHINQNDKTSLLVDIQSHIIPGLGHDYGPSSIDEALTLIMALKDIGYKKIITTPRLSNDTITQDSKIILHVLSRLRTLLKEKNVDIMIEAAGCYRLDDTFLHALQRKELITFDKHYLVIEVAHTMTYELLKQHVTTIQNAGYKVILSHPETYTFIQCDLTKLQELKNLGPLFALDINSISHLNQNETIKQCADMLIENNMVDLLGSNIHILQHVKTIASIQKTDAYQNIFKTNTILNNYLY